MPAPSKTTKLPIKEQPCPAIPLIYSVYFGVAEAARDIAVEAARSHQPRKRYV